MPSIKQLLESKDKEITTGEIVQRSADKKYEVQIGKRTIPVLSLVSETLPRNSRVVVVRTAEGSYITNVENIKSRQIVGVVIDG